MTTHEALAHRETLTAALGADQLERTIRLISLLQRERSRRTPTSPALESPVEDAAQAPAFHAHGPAAVLSSSRRGWAAPPREDAA